MWSRLSAFLRDEGDRALLGWIGGGLMALATGLWAVFTFYVDHSKPSPPTHSIEVHNGNAIASGPNATFNAPVNIGPDAKEVVQRVVAGQNERYEKILAELASKKGAEVVPLRAVLVKLGEAGVPDEDIPKRLDAAADELIKLRAEVEQLRHGPPALAPIANEAQILIDKGDFDEARVLLARWIDKYPFDKMAGDKSLWDQSSFQAAMRVAMGKNFFARAQKEMLGPAVPVVSDGKGLFAVWSCKAHDCGDNQFTVFFNSIKGSAQVCWRNSDDSGKVQDLWLANGESRRLPINACEYGENDPFAALKKFGGDFSGRKD